jgi:hypothetical protein
MSHQFASDAIARHSYVFDRHLFPDTIGVILRMDDSSPSLVRLTRNCGRAATNIIGMSPAPERNVLPRKMGSFICSLP